MMFTAAPPETRGDEIQLFFLSDDALEAVGRGNPVFPVAVHYDALRGRLLPLEPVAETPGWTAPASVRDDHSIAVTEAIPRPLYLLSERKPGPHGSPRPR